MKKKLLKLMLLTTAVFAGMFMAGCKKTGDDSEYASGTRGGTTIYKDEPTEIETFEVYFYSDMAPVNYKFTRDENDELSTKYYFCSDFIFCDEENHEISSDIFEKLAKWTDDSSARSWDGFSMSRSDVMDGSGFNLCITLKTGETISASGYMCYPEGYKAAENKLFEIINEATISAESCTDSNM